MASTSLRLGETEVARVGLGSNRLSYTKEHVSFIRDAVAEGIGHIDSAHLYARGDSERTIGEALPHARDDEVVVATKGGWGGGEGRPELLRAQLDESLRHLRTETIALYYLHRVDPGTPLEESLGAIKEARDAGKVRHVGISNVTVDEIERARRVVPIVAVQNDYNLSNREHDPVVEHCAEQGIVFVAYFPLRGVHSPELDRVAKEHKATPNQIALAWLLHRSPTLLAIPGTLSHDHLKENLAALQIELSQEQSTALTGT